MRIVQIIDSLETGGAERMAVNYANALSEKVEFSGLIATRKEGLLLGYLDEKVSYLFLKKKSSIDPKALSRLINYLKRNKVEIIHAHSSSFFIAALAKIFVPKIKIIWHDHYGISQDLDSRKNLMLKIASFLFLGIISVNDYLKKWALDYLHCQNVSYFPNFIIESADSSGNFQLKGIDGKRIICVANLRPQKNHELLINGAQILHQKFPEWSFHLIGKDFYDDYSKNLAKKANDLQLTETVFFYGEMNNTQNLLRQSEIAVLTSHSEGLPLAVLEYGLSSLPVVATDVGEVKKIIQSPQEGLLIESNNLEQFVKAVEYLIEQEETRKIMGKKLFSLVEQNFSEKSILSGYIAWLKSLTTFAK
ncbi:glycosyltransferase family 4 protein [Flavobacterium ginsenosidimutans]|uniref:glycosyltransferase family 4 protein n=1 Tax=Flavobacterium ginsenosidimutans TaxID=687844 RepID=UPI003D9659F1